jgi:hypothetical protein
LISVLSIRAVTRLRFASKNSAELTTALSGKVFDDPAKLQSFVDGFKQVQAAIDALTTTAVPQFTAQLQAVSDNFDAAVLKVRKYGLAEDKLAAARSKAIADLEAQRAETLRQAGVTLDIGRLAAGGDGQAAEVARQAEQARQELDTFAKSLDALAVTAADIHVERTTTNLLLQSQAFNTTWTATNLAVAADSTTALDGTTTADTLTATGAGGNVAQAVTVSVGRGISVSVHGKPLAASFLWVQVGDGSNAVECWFNLAAGTAGSNTAGTATCVFSQKAIEPHALGFWRCMLDVNTATSTSCSVKFGPAASDGGEPANTNSIYVWGGQAEAELNVSAATSYIPTTTAAVTRSAENIHLPIDSAWFNPSEGTLVYEFVNRTVPNGVPGSHVAGGVTKRLSRGWGEREKITAEG